MSRNRRRTRRPSRYNSDSGWSGWSATGSSVLGTGLSMYGDYKVIDGIETKNSTEIVEGAMLGGDVATDGILVWLMDWISSWFD